jgi:ribonuclease HI
MNDYTDGKIKDCPKLVGYFDGACEPKNPGGVCSSVWLLYSQKGNELLAKDGRIVRDGRRKQPKDILATNNYAEYCALGLMLRFLVDNNWRGSLHIFSDSKLVVHQVTRDWNMKAKHLKPLRERIWTHLETLELEVTLGDNGPTYECFTCGTNGSIDELVEMGDDDENNMICPHCGNTVTCLEPESNCVFEWVPRDQNEAADALGREVYQQYLSANR